ncbi:MAG TPA: PAS domain S-box protein, partial [Candidatus Ozemobacteraceae bacterium]|nr:PAS domain S-box protein [Candidatus Ozemobacteraceae bacterium]
YTTRQALTESERQYRALADLAHDMIFMVSPEFRVLYVNSFAAQHLRATPEQLAGHHLSELFPKDNAERMIENLKQVFATGTARYIEDRMIFPGREIWLDSRLVPLHDEQGKIYAIYGLSRDVSARRAAEEATRTSEERFRMLFERASEAIFVYNQRGLIEEANPRATELSGFPHEQLIGMNPIDFAPMEQRPALAQVFQRLQTEREVTVELQQFRKDGQARDVSATVSLLPDGRYLGMVRDITEQRRLEDELMRSQKLESLGVLAGGIAHDFNNIMTVVFGHLSLSRLLLKTGADIDGKLVEAEKAALRARDLTQQLMSFSKAGTPSKKPTSLTELLTESSSFVLHGTPFTCEYQIPQNLWAIDADDDSSEPREFDD